MTLKQFFEVIPRFNNVKIFNEYYGSTGILDFKFAKTIYTGQVKDFKHFYNYEVLKIIIQDGMFYIMVKRI